VKQVRIWTPDKDLAQCVRGDRVVQVDRRSNVVRNADGVREKFGVAPELIPDYLALVGDSADGYPGVPRIGAKGAARLIALHGPLESFPADVLGGYREDAVLFKRLATLRADVPLFNDADALKWGGPSEQFTAVAATLSDGNLATRASRLAAAL
jgi:5'-3' exonuclease